jgi:hypothetical protein
MCIGIERLCNRLMLATPTDVYNYNFFIFLSLRLLELKQFIKTQTTTQENGVYECTNDVLLRSS